MTSTRSPGRNVLSVAACGAGLGDPPAAARCRFFSHFFEAFQAT